MMSSGVKFDAEKLDGQKTDVFVTDELDHLSKTSCSRRF